MVVPEPQTFDKGLIFVKETNILLSGDKWTIIVNIALDDYDVIVNTMRATLKQVRQEIERQKSPKFYPFDIPCEELNRLDKIIDGLDLDLQSFRMLLFDETLTGSTSASGIRTRRGLINLLGYGMKYLFGTADARDVKRLSDVCDKLHAFRKHMTHAVDHQLTYIQTLDESTKLNAKDIADLTAILHESIRSFRYN